MAAGRMYATLDGQRWFHVPKEVAFSDADALPGALRIRDLLGRKRAVDPAAIAPYEVTGDDAKRLTRVEVVDLLGMARAGLASLRSLVPADRPDGAAGIDAMTGVVDKLVSGLGRAGDPAPTAYAPDDLKARLEGFLREVAADPSRASRLEELAKGLEKTNAGLAQATRELRAKNEER